MTRFLLAGGGTAGHVNPLLALAENLRESGHEIWALGTVEGLELRLVPQRGFQLLTIPRLPFPRRLEPAALIFPFRLFLATYSVMSMIRKHKIQAVVGFGGYASAPAYFAARLSGIPLIIHEANALSGIANRIGARLTGKVAAAFPNTDLPRATITGMPIRKEILQSVSGYDQQQARVELGLDPLLPTLLVTGGSLGAKSINDAVVGALPRLRAAGIQVLHIVGNRSDLSELTEPGYIRIAYCDRMDAAIAAANFAISRAGASTIAEFTACGLPACYIPYPVGNGEQARNAESVVLAGGGLMVLDALFNAEYIESELIGVISHPATLKRMSEAARGQGIPDATERLSALVLAAVNTSSRD